MPVAQRDLKLSDIKEPNLLCLIVYVGGGTKLFQSYLDGHPEIYNIPGYPLLYLYPHWQTWQEEYQEVWNWDTIINLFCIKHASLIDSRNIIGINGLDKLGEQKNEYIAIDGEEFRSLLKGLLRQEPVSRRSFVLAVNYAYALCKGQDITRKKVLLWHHHVIEYLDEFINDFPGAPILATIRDPRIKAYKVYEQHLKADLFKLNATDALINHANVFHYMNVDIFLIQHKLKRLAQKGKVLFLKHEDMAADLARVMRRTADFLGIEFLDLMLESTFDGKVWWVPEVYERPSHAPDAGSHQQAGQISREVLNGVLSRDWQRQKSPREIFVFEGMIYEFLKEYGYEPLYYKHDSLIEKIGWVMANLLPFKIELQETLFYLDPRTHGRVILTAWKEAIGALKRKFYGFNATYFYKYTYVHLKLWRRSSIMHWLDHDRSLAASIAYVLYVYARFWGAILWLPLQYIKRLGDYYLMFFRRLLGGNYVAPLL